MLGSRVNSGPDRTENPRLLVSQLELDDGSKSSYHGFVHECKVQYKGTATSIILDHPRSSSLALNVLRQFSVLGVFSKRDDIRRCDLVGEAEVTGA